jgi:acyl transferase domain-containing protein
MLNPDIMILLTTLNFLSPDSKCQAFDHKANGYARGEGIASIILKPLDAALRDNDLIRGVIRGTAVNQNRKTPGITLPSMEAQVDLIRSAYASAGLSMSETAYFEAHGTGTSAGDSLETGALATTFGRARQTQNPLLVGTVKTNIGHVEGASGLAGLIKAIYVLEKGEIPGNLWFEKANPRILMDEWKIKVGSTISQFL